MRVTAACLLTLEAGDIQVSLRIKLCEQEVILLKEENEIC